MARFYRRLGSAPRAAVRHALEGAQKQLDKAPPEFDSVASLARQLQMLSRGGDRPATCQQGVPSEAGLTAQASSRNEDVPIAKLVPFDEASPSVFGFMAGTGSVLGDIVTFLDETWSAEEDPEVQLARVSAHSGLLRAAILTEAAGVTALKTPRSSFKGGPQAA